MESTNQSLVCPSSCGITPPPSAPDAAVPCSTTPGTKSCATELLLALLLKHLLHETHSADTLYLAFGSAKQEALRMGFTEDEFATVVGRVLGHWERHPNPIRAALF